MKIQRLFLRNVRNIKSLDLDFRDPVTGKPMSRVVLAGANGSGKTTILECIFALLAAADGYGKGKINRHSVLQEIMFALSRDSKMELYFDIAFGDPPSLLSILYGTMDSLVSEPSAEESAVVGGFTKSRAIPEVLLSLSEIAGSKPLFARLAEMIQQTREREAEPVGSILYFPHSRYLPSVEKGQLGYEPKKYQWAYRYKASEEWTGSTENYLFSLNYLDLEDRDRRLSANRFSQTIELVNSILGGKRISRVEKGRVIVETEKGETHGLADLSSGEKQITLLLVEILRRIVPGSIILIDEPEISLHPAWQRGLVVALDKIIEQYDAQVIMATHSPEIASMVLPHEVLFLSDLNAPLGEWKPEQEAIA